MSLSPPLSMSRPFVRGARGLEEENWGVRISLKRVVGVLCDFIPLLMEERRAVPFLQFELNKGSFYAVQKLMPD